MSIAHMSLEFVKQQQRDILAKRAEARVHELESIRKLILHKRIRECSNLIEFFFSFQLFLAGAFIAALFYA